MKTNLKLYGALICPFVQRVRFLLEQAKLPYDYQEISLLNKEHQQEWYKTLNPSAKVPCLIYNENKIVVESLVINEFLCEAFYPQALPNDPFERSCVRRWICFLSDNIIPAFYSLFSKFKESKTEELDALFTKIQEQWSVFVANSQLLSGKPYLNGDTLTLLDYATIPFLNSQDIVSRTILNRSIFATEDKNFKENLEFLRKYLEVAKEKTEFLKTNQKAEVLPSIENDPVFKEFGITKDNLNFDEYVKEYYKKAFALNK